MCSLIAELMSTCFRDEPSIEISSKPCRLSMSNLVLNCFPTLSFSLSGVLLLFWGDSNFLEFLRLIDSY